MPPLSCLIRESRDNSNDHFVGPPLLGGSIRVLYVVCSMCLRTAINMNSTTGLDYTCTSLLASTPSLSLPAPTKPPDSKRCRILCTHSFTRSLSAGVDSCATWDRPSPWKFSSPSPRCSSDLIYVLCALHETAIPRRGPCASAFARSGCRYCCVKTTIVWHCTPPQGLFFTVHVASRPRFMHIEPNGELFLMIFFRRFLRTCCTAVP